ncbi:MAG: hypothetical protein KTR28_04760 [Micavibrio sp.]|nr:hypothetical protein [Micavibrio sp.]
MRHPLLTFAFIAFTTLTPLGASAANEINEQGATQLKAVFQAMLDKQDAKMTGSNRTIERKGNIIVEPAGGYYAVTLPPSTVHYTSKDDAGAPQAGNVEIGMISINATPNAKPKLWNMTLAIPTPIQLTDAAGAKKISYHIGSQKAAGIWHEDLQEFVELDAEYKNITATLADSTNVASIDSAILDYDIKQGANDRWSGPAKTIINGLNIGSPKSEGAFKLNQMTMTFNADQLDAVARKTLGELASTPPESQEPGKLIKTLLTLANGLDMNVQVSGLDFTKGDVDLISNILSMTPIGSKNAESFHLDNAYASVGIKGLLEDKASSALAIGYRGLKNETSNAGDEKLTPAFADIKILPQNIPIHQVAEVLGNELSANNKISPISLMIKLPALLSQAETNIALDSKIGNDFYSITSKGQAKADLMATNGIRLNMTTIITNLDGLLSHAQEKAVEEDNPLVQEYKTLAGTLAALKEIAVPDENVGAGAHKFDLTMSDSGEIQMNGKPAMPLLINLKFPAELF